MFFLRSGKQMRALHNSPFNYTQILSTSLQCLSHCVLLFVCFKEYFQLENLSFLAALELVRTMVQYTPQ